MNKPVIFYHLWRGGEWKRCTEFIFTKIVESGLADECESINICVNDENPLDDINLHGIPEEKVLFRSVKDTKTEWPTLLEIYDTYSSVADTPILYLHSKGASYGLEDPRRQPVIDWVAGLTYYIVEDWRTCMSMMRTGAKCVGANKRRDPTPHFSGNFWWIDSSTLNALPNPRYQNHDQNNRYGAEFWIGNLGESALKNNGLVGFNYQRLVPRQSYAKNYLYNRQERNACVVLDSLLDLSFIKNSNIHHDVYMNGYNSYSIAYLEYIIENYDNLPNVNFFIRTSQLQEKFPNILDVLEHSNIDSFTSLSNSELISDTNGVPHHPGLPIQSIWNSAFEEYECPTSFKFGPGAMFAVTKEEILSNTKNDYEKLLSSVERRISPIQDFALERMWSSIFSEKNIEENDSEYDLEVCIFNHGHTENAIKLYNQFKTIGVNARVLNSSDDTNEDLPNEKYFEKYKNIYYTGLWNKAISKFKGSHLMIITSDVVIDNVLPIFRNSKKFFKNQNNWIYAPNVDYTFWKYDVGLLESYENQMKIVPNTDGMCWIVNKETINYIGKIDNKINKIGFGIDLLACMNANRSGKTVVRDYSVTVKHPQSRSYNTQEAEKQEFEWIDSKKILREYVQYRNNYAMSFLGE